MFNFLEVLPGVCISTRRIVSIEAQEFKDGISTGWRILVFSDIAGDDGKLIVYVYNHQLFVDRESAMVKLGEIVGQCNA